MLIDWILHIFSETGRFWKVDGKAHEPTESDVRKALDEAVKMLYPEKVGTTLNVGGLHIEKTEGGHDVYVYVGDYK